MSLPVANLANLSKDDLNALVQNGVTESNSLDFKRQSYGSSEAEKKELLKDVTAFANAIGGDLALGISKKDGVATALVPLTGNAETELDRLNQILRSGAEPPLLGLSIMPVQVNSGVCIIIRIPRSPLAPHRVSAYGSSRFYVGHGRSAVEATMDELRNLFGRQREMNERARDFQLRTIEHVRSGAPSSRPRGADKTFILLQLFPLQTLIAAGSAIDLSKRAFLSLPYTAPLWD